MLGAGPQSRPRLAESQVKVEGELCGATSPGASCQLHVVLLMTVGRIRKECSWAVGCICSGTSSSYPRLKCFSGTGEEVLSVHELDLGASEVGFVAKVSFFA